MDVFVFDPVVHTLVSTMSKASRWIAISAGILGFTGVVLGAFGAHALKESLVAQGTLAVWQTAVLYQLVHAVALLAIAGWTVAGTKVQWIACCWTVGTILFSDSLYCLSLGGPKFFGPVTPVGGLAFLLGWFLVVWTVLQPSPKA